MLIVAVCASNAGESLAGCALSIVHGLSASNTVQFLLGCTVPSGRMC